MREVCKDGRCDVVVIAMILIVAAVIGVFVYRNAHKPIICCDGSTWPSYTTQGACSGRNGIEGGEACREWKARQK